MKLKDIVPYCLDFSKKPFSTESQQQTYITSPWETEPRGQEYRLNHGDWVFFWKSDEKPVRVGMVYVLWGYYRIIAHERKLIEFRSVEWCNANL